MRRLSVGMGLVAAAAALSTLAPMHTNVPLDRPPPKRQHAKKPRPPKVRANKTYQLKGVRP